MFGGLWCIHGYFNISKVRAYRNTLISRINRDRIMYDFLHQVPISYNFLTWRGKQNFLIVGRCHMTGCAQWIFSKGWFHVRRLSFLWLDLGHTLHYHRRMYVTVAQVIQEELSNWWLQHTSFGIRLVNRIVGVISIIYSPFQWSPGIYCWRWGGCGIANAQISQRCRKRCAARVICRTSMLGRS